MPQIVFAAFLFPTDFTDNTDFRPDRSEVIVTLISQMMQIFDLFGLRFHRFCFWEKVIFCSPLQYRSALVATRMGMFFKHSAFYRREIKSSAVCSVTISTENQRLPKSFRDAPK